MTSAQMHKMGQRLFGVSGWFLIADRARIIAERGGINVSAKHKVVTAMTLNVALSALKWDGFYLPLNDTEYTPEGFEKIAQTLMPIIPKEFLPVEGPPAAPQQEVVLSSARIEFLEAVLTEIMELDLLYLSGRPEDHNLVFFDGNDRKKLPSLARYLRERSAK